MLRFSVILGEDGGIVDDFARVTNFGPFIFVPGDGEQHFQPIIREDAARCVIEALSRVDLYGQTIELGGPEILSYNQLFGFFLAARGISKPVVHLPTALMMPGVMIVGAVMSNPIATPDELNTIVRDNQAESLDAVQSHFNFRANSPSAWAQTHWRARKQG